MSENKQEQVPTAVESLLSEFGQERPPIEIRLRSGTILKFRYPADAAEYDVLSRNAQRFAEMCKNRPSPEWKPFLPTTTAIATACYWLATLAIEPTFSHKDLLQLAKGAGGLIPFIWGMVQTKLGEAMVAEETLELEQLGEG